MKPAINENSLGDSTSLSKSKDSQFNFHWCTQPGFGAQPHYKVASDLWIEIKIVQYIINIWQVRLPASQWPKVFLGAAQ